MILLTGENGRWLEDTRNVFGWVGNDWKYEICVFR